MLRDNEEPEFLHINNIKYTYDTLLLQLRSCGILLYPLDEDVTNVGYKVKDYEAQDRAINDIIMASRQYAIRSHDKNNLIEKDIILAKFKSNIDFDFNFFDDEEVFIHYIIFRKIGLKLLGIIINAV